MLANAGKRWQTLANAGKRWQTLQTLSSVLQNKCHVFCTDNFGVPENIGNKKRTKGPSCSARRRGEPTRAKKFVRVGIGGHDQARFFHGHVDFRSNAFCPNLKKVSLLENDFKKLIYSWQASQIRTTKRK
jgi:hypothetical protein